MSGLLCLKGDEEVQQTTEAHLYFLVACIEQDMPVDIKKHAITTVNIFEPTAVIMMSNYRFKKKNCEECGLSVLFCQSSSTLTYGLGLLLQAQLPAPVVCMPEMT